MRGQKLYVRPIDPADAKAVRAFLAAWTDCESVPESGLIGKLAGSMIAVMALDFSIPESVRIISLVVAPDFRRKRVGRAMLHELESLAAKMERDWLLIEPHDETREFLRRVGFVEGGGGMVRKVAR
jgi:ribosomal protein S18 acetylase RimI-like enzyme